MTVSAVIRELVKTEMEVGLTEDIGRTHVMKKKEGISGRIGKMEENLRQE